MRSIMRIVFIFFILLSWSCGNNNKKPVGNNNKKPVGNNNKKPDRDHEKNFCPIDQDPLINCLKKHIFWIRGAPEELKEMYRQLTPKQQDDAIAKVERIIFETNCKEQSNPYYSQVQKLSPEEQITCDKKFSKKLFLAGEFVKELYE